MTGLSQKTGNFPGTTVESHKGTVTIDGETSAEIIDLPGTYSLYPKSDDERVAVAALMKADKPDCAVVVADASNLKRSLLLCTEIIDLGLPTVLALNMIDIAHKKGLEIDILLLSEQLGIQVIPVNARKRSGIDDLKLAMKVAKPAAKPFYKVPAAIMQFLDELKPVIDGPNNYARLIQAHQVSQASHSKQNIHGIFEKYHFDSGHLQQRETVERFRHIDFVLVDCLSRNTHPEFDKATTFADKILTHKYWGFLIFFGILFTLFQSIFNIAQVPMQLLETAFENLQGVMHESMAAGWANDLLADGVVAGLGGVIVFLPQIIILFAFITILEDSGYMARVSFIMDRMMRSFGMNGRSVVPLIGGMACAVPSIMATRTIENTRDRLITIMVIPLMSCSARLPVYTLLIGLIAPEEYIFGFIGVQGLLLFLMYLVGFVSAMLSAFVFKLILKSKGKNHFVMELPIYKWPSGRNLWYSVFERSKTFVLQAGYIIVAVSVILWYLGSHGPGNAMQDIDKKYSSIDANADPQIAAQQKQTEKLEASYAGRFGQFIEPVIRPLGFDWKIGIALLSSFVAREVFVGTMNTLYSIGNDGQTVQEQLRNRYTPVTALSLMFFYAFALQCTSTIAVVYRETKSWKWPAIQLVFMTALAWLSSFAIYQLGK